MQRSFCADALWVWTFQLQLSQASQVQNVSLVILSIWEGTSELDLVTHLPSRGKRRRPSSHRLRLPHLPSPASTSVLCYLLHVQEAPTTSAFSSMLPSRPSSHSQSLLKPLLEPQRVLLDLAVACLQGPKSLVSPSVGLLCCRLPSLGQLAPFLWKAP